MVGVVGVLAVMILAPIATFAQNDGGGLPGSGNTGGGLPAGGQQITIPNPLNCGSSCTLIDFITTILNTIIMPLAGVAAVVFIIWAGFNYVLAQGNPAKLKEAHQRLLWALIGTGVLLGSAAISQVIQATVKALKP